MDTVGRLIIRIGISVWIVGLVIIFINWLSKALDIRLHLADVSGDTLFRWTGLVGLGFIVIGVGIELLRRIWRWG